MKVSLKWLNKYVDLRDKSPEEIGDALPMLGLEVESVETLGLKNIEHVVVGEILSRVAHPDSDHLGICMVKVSPSEEPIQIVCGASNYKVGDRVPVALVGAKLPTPEGKPFEIKVSKLRGVVSNGMMCSARELGLGQDHSGLLILSQRPEIGTPINDVFPDSDTVYEIELTANRGDCLSHIGVARELAAKFGRKLKMPELKYTPEYVQTPSGGLLESVEVQTPHCPLYTAAEIRGVKIAPSPDWLKRDLEAVGLRSINNVVDVTNYVMMEYGQPLHAFDADRIAGKKIIVRKAADGEKIQTLDEKEYTLDSSVTLICDASRAIAMAGVMGALNSEVEDTTSNVVIESAYFNPGNTRATSRKFGISTDSSYRFARDVDPQSTLDASRRAVDLILETAGGQVCPKTCKVGEKPRGDRDVKISRAYVENATGFACQTAEIADTFERLGFTVKTDGDDMTVTVPSFRSEVDRPVDLVEEFVRIRGTENIPESPMNSVALMRDDDPLFKYETSATNYLADIGLNECQKYTLVDSRAAALVHPHTEFLKLDNPLTSDQDSLRSSLLDGLLETLCLNISNGNSFRGFFENGKIFRADADGVITELASTAFVIAPDPEERAWEKRQAPDFFTAKSVAFNLLGLLGIDPSRLGFEPNDGKMWQEKFSAKAGNHKREGFVVEFGAVSVAHLRQLGISRPVYAGEIAFKSDVAGRGRKGAEKFKPFSAFPPATRDVALIVKSGVPASEVELKIFRAAKQACKTMPFDVESVKLFDVYEGKGVEDGFKSLAYQIAMRADERTLKTDEVNKVFETVCGELEKSYKLRIS